MINESCIDSCGNANADVAITFDNNDIVMGMGAKIPTSHRKIKVFIDDVHISLFQLIDRIASTQLGSVREESREYQHYICPELALERKLKVGGGIPLVNKGEVPDLAQYMKWLPHIGNNNEASGDEHHAFDEGNEEQENSSMSSSGQKENVKKRKYNDAQIANEDLRRNKRKTQTSVEEESVEKDQEIIVKSKGKGVE